ncbi:DUF6461 domain-containing protein [Nonomuraea basaltis]|uniref:DUF6461 domain-containing protein n=1 Tax=Nonomuraea basaltis TaxID=2495887 RepID=UPI00110C491C|nr:DUF6461 domain-containing protein [Nonomuraea basaltis]TMR96612.1 hypothetical protein EJK15_22205 [Nonomuraea basaltis]
MSATHDDDYAWFSCERFPDLADAYCFTYVRGLTPDELVVRLGAQTEDFALLTLGELVEAAYSEPDRHGMFFGATAVGDWVFIVGPNGLLGIIEEIITPLSAGTRLVSHFLNIKGDEYFYWIEDGEIRFCFLSQDGFSEEVPDELVETMERINSGNEPTDLHDGPAFLLAERLTGITLTPELLEESIYLSGAVPESR